jgi:hypothetical protein
MCSGRRSASSVLGAPAQPLFHGANAGRTTALGRDRCPGHDRSCRARHVPRRLQTRCATRPLAPSLSWRFAEGFNDAQLDDDSLPQQWQSNRSVRSLFHDGSYWRVLTVRIASLEVRKGRLHLSERHRRMTLFALTGRLESTTYCGHSRPLPRTPQLGGNRTYRRRLGKVRRPRRSRHFDARAKKLHRPLVPGRTTVCNNGCRRQAVREPAGERHDFASSANCRTT